MTALAQVPVTDGRVFAVNKIICIGRNYAEHVREMGHHPERKAPVFFFKPHSALNTSGTVLYPHFTRDLHHEVELVVGLGAPGYRVNEAEAGRMVGGFAVGLDMTCRDLQQAAKADGGPWDLSKGFDGSAPCSPLQPGGLDALAQFGDLRLTRNGQLVQQGAVSDMIWSVPELIARLSHYFHLRPGDLIFTGTPAGVGPVAVGDQLLASLDGLRPTLAVRVATESM